MDSALETAIAYPSEHLVARRLVEMSDVHKPRTIVTDFPRCVEIEVPYIFKTS